MTGHPVNARRSQQIEAQACAGKFKFANFGAAMAGVRPHMKGRVEPYRCPVCQCWHVGQPDGKKRQANKRRIREARA